ncbi:MAG: acyl carrier protein [Candidatus Korobacteraceae bacterium]|jgi:acyl carrier protein
MSVRSIVLNECEQVARQQGKNLQPLSDDLALLESGLDSLCIAILVARLEDTLGIDPFSNSEEAGIPVTIGDFVKIYEKAMAAAQAATAESR